MHFTPSLPFPVWLRLVLFAAVLLLVSGCTSGVGSVLHPAAKSAPYFTPRNYTGESVLPIGVRRVLLLPVAGGTVATPESAATLDETLHAALQRQARFEVIQLSREDCRMNFGASEFSSASALPHGFLEKASRIYAVDAVMFVDVTVYQPYRPIALGFRAKLATVDGVRLLWSFDETFSTSDPAVTNSVNRYYAGHGRSSNPVDQSPAVMQSPGRFAAYAADAMFATLPPR